MKILHFCPANLATGGTEGIHHLVSELCKCGADAKILYCGSDLSNPQPEIYKKKYNCEYVTAIPNDFDGAIIFPEVWGNRVIEQQFRDFVKVINWQGIDVYRWNNPRDKWNIFLRDKSVIHLTMSEYGMQYLRSLKLNPIKVSDCINDAYFDDYTIDDASRSDVVLYNPVKVKMTKFQQIVMARSTTELGIRFKPIEGYTQEQLIDLFRHSKLYIDFGVFSGRERLPREAVACGCCILTSDKGTAHYYEDNSILDKYKTENVDEAIRMIQYCLHNYILCKQDFDEYRRLLKEDLNNYTNEVKELYNEILNSYTSTQR